MYKVVEIVTPIPKGFKFNSAPTKPIYWPGFGWMEGNQPKLHLTVRTDNHESDNENMKC